MNMAASDIATPESVALIANDLGEKIVTQLRTVFDPEIPVNIYDLGLIYSIDVKPLDSGKADARIEMTLTTPNCPVAGEMPGRVQAVVMQLKEINEADVHLVWDPPWDNSRMSDEARLTLNMF
jgi:FeS assembly SUF system protein